jgi:hypothetical protein
VQNVEFSLIDLILLEFSILNCLELESDKKFSCHIEIIKTKVQQFVEPANLRPKTTKAKEDYHKLPTTLHTDQTMQHSNLNLQITLESRSS